MNVNEALNEIDSAIDIVKSEYFIVYDDNCSSGDNGKPCNECQWAIDEGNTLDEAFYLIKDTIEGII